MEAARRLVHGFEDKEHITAALAAFGLKREQDHADNDLDIWPENEAPFLAFRAMATQWSIGMSGPVGLRLEALPFILEMEGIERARWPEVTEGVRLLERETLRLWRAQQEA